MRAALCATALLAALISSSAALAQIGDFRAQPNAVLQVQHANLLDGVWRVNGLGDLTITTRPEGVLEGSLSGRACHGQYQGNTFAILCEGEGRGPFLISGVATEAPPVATTARSRVAAQPAQMTGQVHQAQLTNRGYVQQVGQLSGTRQ